MTIRYQEYERFAEEINMLLGGERMSLDDMLFEIETIIATLELEEDKEIIRKVLSHD